MIEGLFSNIARGVFALFTDTESGILTRPGVDPATQATDAVVGAAYEVAAAAPPAAPLEGGNPVWIMVVYAALFIVAIYFMMFRGPRRREKKAKEMQASIRTGDNVLVTGGMFGRIVDIGEDSFVVEFGTNRGVRIPVLKSDVLGVREPKLTPPPRQAEVTDKDA